MKKSVIMLICALALFSSCVGEFTRVCKSTDYDYKYEYAKQLFATRKFNQAIILLQEVVQMKKGSEQAEECLFLLGMAHYNNADFESAAATFRKYHQSYPRGIFAEQASFYVGQSLCESTPEPRLDQTPTLGAISAYQQFLDYYPDSPRRSEAQARLFELQDNLVMKEYLSAQLYYNLGGYFGNCTNGGSNYEACIITAQNALKNYPYSPLREKFSVLIMKSKFELAENSAEEKRLDRYRDAEDECYGFLNEYPESEEAKRAESYIKKCKKVTND
jgi:outer membrane protein assembly factor BamD